MKISRRLFNFQETQLYEDIINNYGSL